MGYTYNMNLTQALAVVAKLDPVSVAASTVSTVAIDMSKYRRLVATISVGAMTASSTLDFKFQASATSGGSYADIDGTNCKITQITQAGSGSNTMAELELRAEYFNNTGLRFVKGVLTIAAAASVVGVVIKGSIARYEPASLGNIAGVATPVVF